MDSADNDGLVLDESNDQVRDTVVVVGATGGAY